MASLPLSSAPRLVEVLQNRNLRRLSPTAVLPRGKRLQPLVDLWRMGARQGALIGTHRDPDEDAIFSVLGTAHEMGGGKLPTRARDLVQMTFGDGAVAPHLQPWLQDVHISPGLSGPERALTVTVDCALPHLLKGVWAGLQQSPGVLVVDHHDVVATRESLSVRADARFAPWVDPHADAACIMAAALAEHMAQLDGRSLSVQSAEWFLRGILWDTHDLENPGTQKVTRQVAKDLALRLPDDRLVSVLKDAITAMPDTRPATEHHLDLDRLSLAHGEALFLGLNDENVHHSQQRNPLRPPARDIRRYALDHLDWEWRRSDARVIVLVTQVDKNEFHISCRSREEGPALALAKRLGGGGHARRAASQLTDTTYDAVKKETLRLLREPSIRSAPAPDTKVES